MRIDITSLCFGFKIEKENDSGTPAWATSIGQAPKDVCYVDTKIDGLSEFIFGMMYKSHSDFENLKDSNVPGLEKKEEPRGERERMMFSVFEDVYVNNMKIDGIYTLTYEREDTPSHKNRLHICYAKYLTYKDHSNKTTLKEMAKRLGCSDDACWFVTDISIRNQKDLHFTAIVVNSEHSMIYQSSKERKRAWDALIQDIVEPNYKKPIDSPLQQIYYGAPGTGKSNTIKEATVSAEDEGRVYRTTFHPDSDYSTFVGCYKPTMKRSTITKDGITTTEEKIAYKFVPQAFTKAYVEAWNTTEDVFLVIEEINRGNCAQIFGDLFQLLDRNDKGFSEYPIESDTDLAAYLAEALSDSQRDDIPENVQNGTKLLLPSNLYIWATMNTSDQSLFPIDSAFKRRWDWTYIPIVESEEDEFLVKVGEKYYDWWTFVSKMNGIVESVTSSEDKQLGYYFCKPDEGNNIITAKRFVSKVLFYLWNDVFKNYGFDAMLDGKKVFACKNDAGEDTTMVFTSFFEKDGNPNLKQVETLINNLGLEAETIIPNDAATTHIAKSERNYDKFVINGGTEEYAKLRIATEAVRLYVKNNSTLTAQEVANAWNGLEIGIPNFVMTQGEHNELKSATAKTRCNKVEWDDQVVYVTTHLWGDDYGYINKLIEEVNKTDWGITIERKKKI